MSAEWQFLITLNEQLRPLKDPVEIQEAAVRLIGEHLHASRVHYAHIDGDEFVISRSYADGVPPFAGRGPVARFGTAIVDACRRGETVVVDDVNTDPRFTDAEREQLLAAQTAAFVGTPLIKDGRWLATFGVHSATPRSWTRDQIALIEVTAERTWGAAERARAEEALGRSESRQAFLRRLNDAIRPLADPARILEETCRLLGTHLRVNRVVYAEIEGDDCIVVHDYVDGVASLVGHLLWRNLVGSRTADILEGWTLSVNDTSSESHTAEERAALQAADIGAYVCPLLIKDGRFVGAFGVHSRSPRVWTPDEIALVRGSRRSDLGDARAPQGGSRTARERRAAGVSAPAERRDPPVERCGGHPGNCGTAPVASISAQRASATRKSTGREYIIRREHTRGVEPLVGRAAANHGRGRAARGTPARRDHRRQRRAGGFAAQRRPTGRRSGRARSGRLSAWRCSRTGRWWPRSAPITTRRASGRRGEIELVREVAERTWDAVERTRAEAALREQKTRLRLALEASAGGSWTWDLRTNESDWDEAFRAQFGFTPDEPPSFETWLSRVHVDDRPRMRRTLEEILQTQGHVGSHLPRRAP